MENFLIVIVTAAISIGGLASGKYSWEFVIRFFKKEMVSYTSNLEIPDLYKDKQTKKRLLSD